MHRGCIDPSQHPSKGCRPGRPDGWVVDDSRVRRVGRGAVRCREGRRASGVHDRRFGSRDGSTKAVGLMEKKLFRKKRSVVPTSAEVDRSVATEETRKRLFRWRRARKVWDVTDEAGQ